MYRLHLLSLIVFFSVCLIFIYGCAAKKTITYSYADGSGNTYIISGTKDKTLEYNPVQPHLSSSGTYSGGDYIKKKISGSQYDNIASSINKAVNNKAIQIENRVKRSGLITIQKNKSRIIYIIKPDSKEQLQIEKALKETIKP